MSLAFAVVPINLRQTFTTVLTRIGRAILDAIVTILQNLLPVLGVELHFKSAVQPQPFGPVSLPQIERVHERRDGYGKLGHQRVIIVVLAQYPPRAVRVRVVVVDEHLTLITAIALRDPQMVQLDEHHVP